MSSKSGRTSRANEKLKQDIPVMVTELSIFDDNFASLRQQFMNEMRRIEGEMVKFSTNLSRFYDQKSANAVKASPSKSENEVTWGVITSSPLVHEDGENKSLKLQFDLSQFNPEEIQVKVLNDVLIVSATHEEKTDNAIIYRQYNREFLLPQGTDPDTIKPSLTKDGVLLVQTPLPDLALENISATQKS